MMTTSGIISIPLIFSTIALHHKAFTNPNPNRAQTTPVLTAGFVEKSSLCHYAFTSLGHKAIVWLVGGAEIAIILARNRLFWKHSREVLQNLVPSGDYRRIGEMNPWFLTGAGLIIAGSVLRWVCFRTLGRMFTFDVAVQKDHRLITSGPYSIMRHPSYFGLLLIVAGLFIWQGGPASFTRQSGILNKWGGKAFVTAYATWLGILGLGPIYRAHKEDALMRREFGDQWTEWASRTNLVIPWLY
ncbi:hypothetical protein BDP27DRAFT_1299666 [Rhodocollybia butyracea]|uniref:Protein-S-isoprenylcysteine O-methyltransferase n=1 Tax=Rhodocollybia butyracea TaxID=206335 RepID=A0A9P5U369_9AGAR|nr:hypothetical protein BDP27DRAFT_1299666 [Rhodocollybia butyracea]